MYPKFYQLGGIQTHDRVFDPLCFQQMITSQKFNFTWRRSLAQRYNASPYQIVAGLIPAYFIYQSSRHLTAACPECWRHCHIDYQSLFVDRKKRLPHLVTRGLELSLHRIFEYLMCSPVSTGLKSIPPTAQNVPSVEEGITSPEGLR